MTTLLVYDDVTQLILLRHRADIVKLRARESRNDRESPQEDTPIKCGVFLYMLASSMSTSSRNAPVSDCRSGRFSESPESAITDYANKAVSGENLSLQLFNE